ncbi:MAG TPA: hypothetical protein VHB21_05680, partial [Minicystis sp.]|nr:hypothetical protein [Minicystis sp.]
MSSTRHDVDALLARWPALGKDGRALPAEGDAGWEARADAIVAKARAAPRADAAALDALVAAPVLAGEPGEPGAQEASRSAARSLAAKPASGEITMSSPSDSGGSKSGPPPSMPKPRQSLREIAERASQSGRSGSMAPTSTPLPGRGSSPVLAPPPSRASTPDVKPAASTPLPSAPAVKRAAEGKSDDSGIVDLNIVKSTADARTVAAAEKAKPGEASLFEDDAAPASSKSAPAKAAGAAKSAAAKPSVAKAAPAPASKSSGSTVGIVIALVGVAAAFAIWQVRKGGAHETAHEQAGRPAATAAAAAPETKATAAPKAATTAAPAAVARAEGDHDLDPMNLPDEDDTAHPGHPRVRGPMPGAKEKD